MLRRLSGDNDLAAPHCLDGFKWLWDTLENPEFCVHFCSPEDLA